MRSVIGLIKRGQTAPDKCPPEGSHSGIRAVIEEHLDREKHARSLGDHEGRLCQDFDPHRYANESLPSSEMSGAIVMRAPHGGRGHPAVAR